MSEATSIDLRVGLLIACEGMRRGVASLLHDLHCEVVQGAQFNELQFELRLSPVGLLVAEQALVDAALLLVAKAHVPVAVLAPTLLASFGVLDDQRLAGVVIPPISRGQLADLLATMLGGVRYRPSLLQAQIAGVQLTRREQCLLQLRLAGYSLDDIAEQMEIDPDTALRYERRIRERLAKVERSPSWLLSAA